MSWEGGGGACRGAQSGCANVLCLLLWLRCTRAGIQLLLPIFLRKRVSWGVCRDAQSDPINVLCYCGSVAPEPASRFSCCCPASCACELPITAAEGLVRLHV